MTRSTVLTTRPWSLPPSPPNVTIPVDKWAVLTKALFTGRPGPQCLQGREDDISSIWARPFLIYNALLVLSQGTVPFGRCRAPLLPASAGVSLGSSAPRPTTSQTQTPAAQLVCLTVYQTRRILLSSSPAFACLFFSTSPSLSPPGDVTGSEKSHLIKTKRRFCGSDDVSCF